MIVWPKLFERAGHLLHKTLVTRPGCRGVACTVDRKAERAGDQRNKDCQAPNCRVAQARVAPQPISHSIARDVHQHSCDHRDRQMQRQNRNDGKCHQGDGRDRPPRLALCAE